VRPLASVVIANYNYGPFLAQAVDSVLAQTYPHVELVVVDDGSTDESHQVLDRYGARVKVVRQENRGVSAARNRGLRESGGELVSFLDSDDAWLPDKLARQVPLFDRPSVGMVYCQLRLVDERGGTLGTMPPGLSGSVLEDLALLRGPGVPAAGSSAMVRRAVLDEVGGFDESLSTSADWDLWRRIACRYEIDLVREPLVLYRQHDRAMHRDVRVFERDMLRAFESMFRDPSAASIHPLRNRCYGNLHWMLAGSHLYAGNPLKCAAHLGRALLAWPPSLGKMLGVPLRRAGLSGRRT
jgi:glycosyltransferase involved in cell wall biosynthesis